MQVPANYAVAFADSPAVRPDWDLASATKRLEHGSFCVHSKAGGWIVQRGDGVTDVLVVAWLGERGVIRGTGLQRQRTLAGSRAELFNGKSIVGRLRAVQAVETSRGKHQCVAFAFRELSQTRVHVAAHLDESDVRPQRQ